VGSAFTSFALPLQVYDIMHSPFAVGARGIASVVPTRAVCLLGGALADATDRRRLILFTTFGQATVSAALAAQAFARHRSRSETAREVTGPPASAADQTAPQET